MLYQTGEDEKKQSRNPSALGGGPPPLAANEGGGSKNAQKQCFERGNALFQGIYCILDWTECKNNVCLGKNCHLKKKWDGVC